MKCINEFLQYFGESTEPKKRMSSKGIIVLDGKKILLLRIETGCHAEGVWDLPGGGVEDNENAIDCLKREVKEETNLDLVDGSIKSLNTTKDFDIPEDGVHAKWKYFRADAVNGNVVLNPAKWNNGHPEHCEYKWIETEFELNGLDLCDEHRSIIQKELRKLSNK